MGVKHAQRDADAVELGARLERDRDVLIDEWAQAVRERTKAAGLHGPALLDHMPDLLDELATALTEAPRADPTSAALATADEHGRHRFAIGMDLPQVIAEYAILREVLLGWAKRAAPPAQADAAASTIHGTIDRAIARSAQAYVEEHTRTLEAAIQAREDVLAVVSHELRNPLTSVTLQAATLSAIDPSAPKAARIRRRSETILRAAQHMDRLIQDLLDLSSIDAGQLSLDKRPTQTEDLLRDAISMFEDTARERDVTLESHVDDDVGTVCCDRDRIVQVLTNLMSNAAQVSPRGARIRVSAACADAAVVFSVADEGPGIAASELPHVFERRFRGQRRTYKGSGLGLAISKAIVDAHGGTIRGESTQGQGATFSFTLPAGPSPNEDAALRHSQTRG